MFFALIELVSELSRPISLGLRLFVNITVGHFLIQFIYFLTNIRCLFYPLVLLPIMLELVVFIIQGYIFASLVYLYLGY